mmetsp:Transcript_17282/g.46828  ORF Transcript_17282/g.46828 Transcript_17282/m.46828 type:complete len:446 (-) Transcript_17282:1894-3231(-)
MHSGNGFSENAANVEALEDGNFSSAHTALSSRPGRSRASKGHRETSAQVEQGVRTVHETVLLKARALIQSGLQKRHVDQKAPRATEVLLEFDHCRVLGQHLAEGPLLQVAVEEHDVLGRRLPPAKERLDDTITFSTMRVVLQRTEQTLHLLVQGTCRQQLAVQQLGCFETHRGVLVQQRIDDGDDLRLNTVTKSLGVHTHGCRSFSDARADVLSWLCLVQRAENAHTLHGRRRGTIPHLEEDHASAVHVCTLVVGVPSATLWSPTDLWSRVESRADACRQLASRIPVSAGSSHSWPRRFVVSFRVQLIQGKHFRGEAEVTEFGMDVFFIQENIRWFEIAVNHFLCVDVTEAVQYLSEELPDQLWIFLQIPCVVVDGFTQGSAVTEFHLNVQMPQGSTFTSRSRTASVHLLREPIIRLPSEHSGATNAVLGCGLLFNPSLVVPDNV